MKKVITLLLAVLTSFLCFAGCGGTSDSGNGGIPWPPVDSGEPEKPAYDNSWPQKEPANDSFYTAENLVWNDEFNGDTLDGDKWSYDIGNGKDGWGNQELQYYRQDNVRVNGGKLQIMARYENYDMYSYTSGKIHSRGKFSRAYGRFEAKIKLPKGTGIWPAFWMMPQDNVYGGWPHSGEIDIMEARGRLPNQVSGALHFNYPEIIKTGKGMLPSDSDISDWHVYALEWTPDRIEMFVDGRSYLYAKSDSWSTVDEDGNPVAGQSAPFDQPFYLILNLAVGGKFDEHRKPDPSSFGALMEVDYVRVYSLDK